MRTHEQQAQHFKVLEKVHLKLGVMSTIAPSAFVPPTAVVRVIPASTLRFRMWMY
jgi:hypothetical protein